jgi:biopolymer transport protein ExbD
MRRRSRKSSHPPEDINITAFMNLMVILVPFLLITAVFSRLTILELNLPASSSSAADNKQELQLEIIIRKDALEIGERSTGVIRRLNKIATGYDFMTLSRILQDIKLRFPDKLNATILPEQDTNYDTLVQVMDTVRVANVVTAGSVAQYELFPEISIGDAPVAGGDAARANQGAGR